MSTVPMLLAVAGVVLTACRSQPATVTEPTVAPAEVAAPGPLANRAVAVERVICSTPGLDRVDRLQAKSVAWHDYQAATRMPPDDVLADAFAPDDRIWVITVWGDVRGESGTRYPWIQLVHEPETGTLVQSVADADLPGPPESVPLPDLSPDPPAAAPNCPH